MARLAGRLARLEVRLEARQRAQEEQEQIAMIRALTDEHLEEFIGRIEALEQEMILETLTEEELRTRQANLVADLRQRASEDNGRWTIR